MKDIRKTPNKEYTVKNKGLYLILIDEWMDGWMDDRLSLYS
jgi:hypothetical protein